MIQTFLLKKTCDKIVREFSSKQRVNENIFGVEKIFTKILSDWQLRHKRPLEAFEVGLGGRGLLACLLELQHFV